MTPGSRDESSLRKGGPVSDSVAGMVYLLSPPRKRGSIFVPDYNREMGLFGSRISGRGM